MQLYWVAIKVEHVYKKIKRLTEQYRLTNQLKFIDHCKDMPLAYKISDISCFGLSRARSFWKSSS